MARFFADEDFPEPVVVHLRILGHDVLTTRQAGLANIGTIDAAIVARATSDGRAVLTMNRRDFIILDREDPVHSGIIVCTRDDDVEALAKRIHEVIVLNTSLHGLLIRINKPSDPQLSRQSN